MTPTPISPDSIRVFLQYTLPPSQLTQPLPPYLLSKSLLQRHHFLSISPEDPLEYLCWPSTSEGPSAIDLLEVTRPLDDDTPLECVIQYSTDDEFTYAHVHLTTTDQPGVRLVFQWDDFDGWKYHDAKLMPFPPSCLPSLNDTLNSQADKLRPLTVPDSPKSHRYDAYGFDVENDNSDDDAYWNAYGGQDMDDSSPSNHYSFSNKESSGDTEDAYWARYSSVHGTADSTRPSPLPLHRRKQNHLDQLPTDPNEPFPLSVTARVFSDDGYQDPIPIPPESIIRPITRNPWDPASPETLSRLLSALSPRESRAPSPEPTSDLETELDSLSPPTDASSGTDISEVRSPIALGLFGDDVSSVDHGHLHEPSTLSALDIDVAPGVGMSMNSVRGDIGKDEDDFALKESLRGLYALWKSVRGTKGVSVKESDKDAFLRMVEEVVQ
ncbi:hypothetical protein NLI96_g12011 [Meripilus lineatus]|uniref:Uncharacterized protein n=1 Tax=Meripilus lineatus TaxID=2056292 RepID=A0AAD5UT69_9APHY|nr:hypothetical protein NLI96_g12011 [Physisporinus lineatus]